MNQLKLIDTLLVPLSHELAAILCILRHVYFHISMCL